ncbi:LIC_13387 family protein [Parapedobacter tibetensis]|uniref:LIC_13387 family protein n=1 Tax=Parapedobacter tibetensis TaxID=2972951 RepID=UPI00214DA9B2|nr:hypothetical protein [Parapedobacter tibetensis]
MAKIQSIARISIMLGSATLLFFGLLHLHGTFFSTDLAPADQELLVRLKSSHIQMDKTGNLWKLWIGFNAMFSVGLIFIGAINLYLAARKNQLFPSLQFISLLTVVSNAFFVWVGYQYMIADFAISMVIPLSLFVIGFAFNQYQHMKQNKIS